MIKILIIFGIQLYIINNLADRRLEDPLNSKKHLQFIITFLLSYVNAFLIGFIPLIIGIRNKFYLFYVYDPSGLSSLSPLILIISLFLFIIIIPLIFRILLFIFNSNYEEKRMNEIISEINSSNITNNHINKEEKYNPLIYFIFNVLFILILNMPLIINYIYHGSKFVNSI